MERVRKTGSGLMTTSVMNGRYIQYSSKALTKARSIRTGIRRWGLGARKNHARVDILAIADPDFRRHERTTPIDGDPTPLSPDHPMRKHGSF